MKSRQLLMFIFLTTFALTTHAAEAYIGQFLYQYKSGNIYRVIVKDAVNMKWTCIHGSELGATGEETPQRFKLNSRTFFLTWVEKTGVQVSQAIDFKGMKVYSTVTDAQDRYVLEGTVVREK